MHIQHACTQRVHIQHMCTHNTHALNMYAHSTQAHTCAHTQAHNSLHTHPTALYRWWAVGHLLGTRRHILLGCPSPSEVPSVGTTLPHPHLPERGWVSLILHLPLCRTVPP